MRANILRLRRDLIDGYAEFYREHRATHALTISLGNHPRAFSPEIDFLPQLRRIAREIARIRGVPKRKLLSLSHSDAVWMAGFYEATDAAGELFPHWHGVIALKPGEDSMLRECMKSFVGFDRAAPTWERPAASRCVITTPKSKPSFDLQPLTTPHQYITYSTKTANPSNLVHWTIADILPY